MAVSLKNPLLSHSKTATIKLPPPKYLTSPAPLNSRNSFIQFFSPVMNCLQNLPRSYASPAQGAKSQPKTSPSSIAIMGTVNFGDQRRSVAMKAVPSSASSVEKSGSEPEEEKKSEVYSQNMTQAMGATLTYRHELGMNYTFITPDLIVGSCLQTPEDVDKLREIGVKTVFCLQQDPDLEYFGVDISAIREYANSCGDIEHLRAEIRDFDAYDLRLRLPAVASKLHKAIKRNGGVTYIHCTAGMGRAPGLALTYMFWVLGYKLMDAHSILMSKRSCFPKLEAIKSATADILTGSKKKLVSFTWDGKNCTSVEMAGLDIGWGQRMPLTFDKQQGLWILRRDLPEGKFEYKYIVDGEWICNQTERVTTANKDGHVNNYVEVIDNDPNSVISSIRNRLFSDDPDLNEEGRVKIREFLETYPDF